MPDQLRARWRWRCILELLAHTFGVSSFILKVVHSLHEEENRCCIIIFAFSSSKMNQTMQQINDGPTCRRNLFAMRLSGETSGCLHVKQMCSSESNKAVLIPENKKSLIRQKFTSYLSSMMNLMKITRLVCIYFRGTFQGQLPTISQ